MEKADKILQALFERLNIHDEHGYAKLFSTWRTVCDEVSSRGFADHSRIVDVRNGAVVVAVDHPGWIQLIQMHERRILSRLQQRFPSMNLEAIHFHMSEERVDMLGEARGRGAAERSRTTAEHTARDDARPEKESRGVSDTADNREVLERIEDPEFRRTLERLREDLETRDTD